jgi:hypothetical protein
VDPLEIRPDFGGLILCSDPEGDEIMLKNAIATIDMWLEQCGRSLSIEVGAKMASIAYIEGIKAVKS